MEPAEYQVGRRDFFAMLMWIIAALVGRWTIPPQLAKAAEVVDKVLFKGKPFQLTVLIKGFEVSEDWYRVLSEDVEVRQVIADACGVRFVAEAK